MANPQIEIIAEKILDGTNLSKNDIAYLVDRLILNPPESSGGWVTEGTTTLTGDVEIINTITNKLHFNSSEVSGLGKGIILAAYSADEVVSVYSGADDISSYAAVIAAGAAAESYVLMQAIPDNGAGVTLSFTQNSTTDIATAIFEDSRTVKKGIEYLTDYSAGFTDRSLADWGNVWKAKGITTISANTTIKEPNNNKTFKLEKGSPAITGYSTLSFLNDGQIVLETYDSSYSIPGSSLSISPTSCAFGFGSDGAYFTATSGSNGMMVADSNSAGLYYENDYSTTGILDHGDRWIPDWGNVWKVNNTTNLTSATSILSSAGADLSFGDGFDNFGSVSIFANTAINFNHSAVNVSLIDNKGLQYSTDLSATFVDRSLIDKGYNDKQKLRSYTVAGVPSATTEGAGTMIYISNEAGGAVPAFSDGSNWRRVTDRAVIS